MALKKLSITVVKSEGLGEVESFFLKRSEPFMSEDSDEIRSKLKGLIQEGEISQEDVDKAIEEGDVIGLRQDESKNWLIRVVTPQNEALELSLGLVPIDSVDVEWPSEEIPF